MAFHKAVGIDRYDSAAEWSDKQESVKPVIAALRKAIKQLGQKEEAARSTVPENYFSFSVDG